MTPGVPPRLPLTSQRLVVVAGKGGAGKTPVTAAHAHAATAGGRRVLAVEVGRGPLGLLLGGTRLGSAPMRVTAGLAAASLEPEVLLGDFVEGVLRFRILARRLLESTSFQVLAAAAPGLGEFLVLHRLLGWVEARRRGRPVYDLVVVDAPASGHSLPLLAAPHTLGALASRQRAARIPPCAPPASSSSAAGRPRPSSPRSAGRSAPRPYASPSSSARRTRPPAWPRSRPSSPGRPASRHELARRRAREPAHHPLRGERGGRQDDRRCRARGRGGAPRAADGRADRRPLAPPEGCARPLRARRPSEPGLARRDRGARGAPGRAPPRREAHLRRARAHTRHHPRAGARRAREPALPEPLRHARRHGRVHGGRAGVPSGGRGRLRSPRSRHAARAPRGGLPGRAAPAGAPPRLARLRRPDGPDPHPPPRRLPPRAAPPRPPAPPPPPPPPHPPP